LKAAKTILSQKLEPGDTLLAFTDGVTEAKNSADRLYGFDRLAAAMQRPYTGASDLLAKITDDLAQFTAGAEQSDDITILVAHYASQA
jgi:sigma-B regulation protein RsbU (phosphoserine phosphatase)